MKISLRMVGFGIGALVLIGFGVALATYVVSGLLVLGGFIALVEGIKPLRWLVSRTTKILDVGIFVASAVALVTVGTTVAVGMSVAGIGFSLLYGPFLRRRLRRERLMAKGLTSDSADTYIDNH